MAHLSVLGANPINAFTSGSGSAGGGSLAAASADRVDFFDGACFPPRSSAQSGPFSASPSLGDLRLRFGRNHVFVQQFHGKFAVRADSFMNFSVIVLVPFFSGSFRPRCCLLDGSVSLPINHPCRRRLDRAFASSSASGAIQGRISLVHKSALSITTRRSSR